MLTWLRNRPANTRRAARPAQSKLMPPSVEPVPVADEELPPPFFADADAAFLDLSEPPPAEVAMTPPPLPISQPVAAVETRVRSPEERLTLALKSLPPWPSRNAPRRTDELLEILRQLDRIAGDVCSNLDSDAVNDEFEPPRKSR